MSGRRQRRARTTSADAVTDDRWSAWADAGLPIALGRRLAAHGTHAAPARVQLETLAEELQDHLDESSPTEAVRNFLADAETVADRRDRQAALSTLEVLSRLPVSPISWPPCGAVLGAPRLLTSIELGFVRLQVRRSPSRALVIGQLEAGASVAEFPGLIVDRFDRAQAGTIGVRLPGHGTVQPRNGFLPAWSTPAAAAQLAGTAPGRHPLHRGDNPTFERLRTKIHQRAVDALTVSGFASDPDVTPLSVTRTVARAIHDIVGPEAAAAFLGHPKPTAIRGILHPDCRDDRPAAIAA